MSSFVFAVRCFGAFSVLFFLDVPSTGLVVASTWLKMAAATAVDESPDVLMGSSVFTMNLGRLPCLLNRANRFKADF